MRSRLRAAGLGLGIVFLGTALSGGACSKSDSPASPSPPAGTPVQTTTLTITASGVTPNSIQIAVGQSVTVVNNDSRSHAISSDPHPSHTDCPAINQLGSIPAGATRQTAAFTTARTCGFHDHDLPNDASLRGQIRIQ